jgi:hypothetical protein
MSTLIFGGPETAAYQRALEAQVWCAVCAKWFPPDPAEHRCTHVATPMWHWAESVVYPVPYPEMPWRHEAGRLGLLAAMLEAEQRDLFAVALSTPSDDLFGWHAGRRGNGLTEVLHVTRGELTYASAVAAELDRLADERDEALRLEAKAEVKCNMAVGIQNRAIEKSKRLRVRIKQLEHWVKTALNCAFRLADANDATHVEVQSLVALQAGLVESAEDARGEVLRLRAKAATLEAEQARFDVKEAAWMRSNDDQYRWIERYQAESRTLTQSVIRAREEAKQARQERDAWKDILEKVVGCDAMAAVYEPKHASLLRYRADPAAETARREAAHAAFLEDLKRPDHKTVGALDGTQEQIDDWHMLNGGAP